jgi:ribonuclease HII
MKRKYLKSYLHKDRLEAGCDEAGRGCLAGPVVAAAVILPNNFRHPLLNDSKLLNEAARETLCSYIEDKALAYAIGFIDHKQIDEVNILNASFLAMHKAIDQLSMKPDFLLIDGNRFTPYAGIDHSCEIKGDGRFKSIAAASVLAKTHRDRYMDKLHESYPDYHWRKNKGYPTKAHRAAIEKVGPCPYHRMSFTLLKSV